MKEHRYLFAFLSLKTGDSLTCVYPELLNISELPVYASPRSLKFCVCLVDVVSNSGGGKLGFSGD